MTYVRCKDAHCDECGRLVGDDCRRLVEHRHKLYNLERGAVCGRCWVQNRHAPTVESFPLKLAAIAAALGAVLTLAGCGESNVCPYPTIGHEFPAISNCVTPSPSHK